MLIVIIIIWYLIASFPKYLKHFIGIALLFLMPPLREGQNRELISISLREEAETQRR